MVRTEPLGAMCTISIFPAFSDPRSLWIELSTYTYIHTHIHTYTHTHTWNVVNQLRYPHIFWRTSHFPMVSYLGGPDLVLNPGSGRLRFFATAPRQSHHFSCFTVISWDILGYFGGFHGNFTMKIWRIKGGYDSEMMLGWSWLAFLKRDIRGIRASVGSTWINPSFGHWRRGNIVIPKFFGIHDFQTNPK